MVQICSKCKIPKPLSEFHKKKTKRGVATECKACANNRYKAWRQKNPGKHSASQTRYLHSPKGKIMRKRTGRKAHLKYCFDITIEEYDRVLEEQSSVCAICGGLNNDGRRLFIDHDHDTGKIRGLLCNQCNTWLGRYDNKAYLSSVQKYLGEI